MTGQLPLKVCLTAKILKTGIGSLSLDNRFITKVVDAFREQESNHQTNGFGRLSGVGSASSGMGGEFEPE